MGILKLRHVYLHLSSGVLPGGWRAVPSTFPWGRQDPLPTHSSVPAWAPAEDKPLQKLGASNLPGTSRAGKDVTEKSSLYKA